MGQIIYSVAEASELLKVNKNMVYGLIKKGHLRAMKLGTLKITEFALNEFLRNYEGKNLKDLDNVVDL